MEKKIGVYSITNLVNGKRYIGSSTNIKGRFCTHKKQLNKGIHHNPKLQAAWNKHGEESFRFDIVDYCEDVEELIVWEQQWIDSLKPFYNVRLQAHTNYGLKRSPEICKKIGDAQRGKPSPRKGKTYGGKPKKIRSPIGRHWTEERKHRMSVIQKGKPNFKNRGRPNPNKGKPRSVEISEKVSRSVQERWDSNPEYRQAQSEGVKQWWAKRKLAALDKSRGA
jgi:GIY-YIG catalytic domain/NUMOD3 motif